jgi:hypothetical protein
VHTRSWRRRATAHAPPRKALAHGRACKRGRRRRRLRRAAAAAPAGARAASGGGA